MASEDKGLGAEAEGVMGVCDEPQYDIYVSLWLTSLAVPICVLVHLYKPSSEPAAATHQVYSAVFGVTELDCK